MENDPPACVDCRYHFEDSLKCWHPQARHHDIYDGEKRSDLRDMREGWRGREGPCGRAGVLFEAPPPMTFWEKRGCLIYLGLFAFALFVGSR